MASSFESYNPRFTCKKCGNHITIFEWRIGELCKRCRGILRRFQ